MLGKYWNGRVRLVLRVFYRQQRLSPWCEHSLLKLEALWCRVFGIDFMPWEEFKMCLCVLLDGLHKCWACCMCFDNSLEFLRPAWWEEKENLKRAASRTRSSQVHFLSRSTQSAGQFKWRWRSRSSPTSSWLSTRFRLFCPLLRRSTVKSCNKTSC